MKTMQEAAEETHAEQVEEELKLLLEMTLRMEHELSVALSFEE